MFDEKNRTLHVYSVDGDGVPDNYDITTSNQPKENCLSFRICIKESMQMDKLKIVIDGLFPKIEYTEPLKEVTEGEFGYELIEPEINLMPAVILEHDEIINDDLRQNTDT